MHRAAAVAAVQLLQWISLSLHSLLLIRARLFLNQVCSHHPRRGETPQRLVVVVVVDEVMKMEVVKVVVERPFRSRPNMY